MALPIVLTAAMDAFFGRATTGLLILRNLAGQAFEKYNPAGFIIVQRNIDNLTASIGGLVAPAIDIFNQGLLIVNQTLTALKPVIDNTFGQLKQVFGDPGPLIKELKTDLIALVTGGLAQFMAVIKLAAAIIATFSSRIDENRSTMIQLRDVIHEVTVRVIELNLAFEDLYGRIERNKTLLRLLTGVGPDIVVASLRSTDWLDKVFRKKAEDIINKSSNNDNITQAAYKAHFEDFDTFMKHAYESSFGGGVQINPSEFYKQTLAKQDETNKILDAQLQRMPGVQPPTSTDRTSGLAAAKLANQ